MSNDSLHLQSAGEDSSPGFSPIHDPTFSDYRLGGVPPGSTSSQETSQLEHDVRDPKFTNTDRLEGDQNGSNILTIRDWYGEFQSPVTESKLFQNNQNNDHLDLALLDLAFDAVESDAAKSGGKDAPVPPAPPVGEDNPHVDLSRYDRETQELIKKDGRGAPLTREERVKLESLDYENPAERELYQKLMIGKITRDEKAGYIGIQEFNPSFDNNAEPSELVKKEVLGTITREEIAKLHAYREFRYDNQARQRELSTKEFLKTATPAEQAELNSWREFPLAKFGRARSLVVKEQTTGLTPTETKELAAEREKPRIPIHGAFSIVADGDSPKVALPSAGPRAERVKEIAKREFPDNPKAQDLVVKYMHGILTRAEAANLGALREFPDEPIPRQLQEKEAMGTIKPVEKAYLSACREFPSHLPGAPDARRLAALETNDSISAHDAAVLAGHREFSGTYLGLDIPVPKDAVVLASREREGTISGDDARRLVEVRDTYKRARNKAMQDSTPPPPPMEPTPPPILNAPQPTIRRR